MAARKKTPVAKKKSTAKKAPAAKKKPAAKKAAAKKAARKTSRSTASSEKRAAALADQVKARNAKLDKLTVKLIRETATDVHGDILKRSKPDLHFPVRSLGNVSYSEKRGYFEIGKQKKTRTLTVNTVKSFAQTLRMMGLSKEMVESNDFATKRDAYYQSKNW
ncbi:MAG: hypothetical protein MJE66_17885, partial [Proteobacteria bacterium]|nr:hypothetical protein [Pseudomonadota bacterium]